LRAFGQDRDGLALTGGLEAVRNFSGVKFMKDGAVADDGDILEGGVSAAEVGDPELVDKMNALVGAGEGRRRIEDTEKEGVGSSGSAASASEGSKIASRVNATTEVRRLRRVICVVRANCREGWTYCSRDGLRCRGAVFSRRHLEIRSLARLG